MRYEELTRYSDSEFKRLVGVPRPLFQEMVEILHHAEGLKRKSGRPHTLSMENQLLLTLNYLRSYGTQLELSAHYHIAESNVNRTIKKVEDALVQSRRFTLPKRKPLENEDFNWVISVHDKFHRTLILSGFCLLKIAKISLNSSFFPKPIKR